MTPLARVGVTPLQNSLVRGALKFLFKRGRRPTAEQLAREVDIAQPVVWGELKVLARLGVVEWGRTVRVLREPDGIVVGVRAAS